MSHTTAGKETNTPANIKDYWQATDYAYRDACALVGVNDFDIDAAATHENTLCFEHIDEESDALTGGWFFYNIGDTVWCNPPFSKKLDFIKQAYQERKHGLICMMLPYEPCTRWWRENVDGKASLVYVPDGRYNYISPETGKEVKGVNFCSAFVVFTSLTMPTTYVQFKRGVGNE